MTISDIHLPPNQQQHWPEPDGYLAGQVAERLHRQGIAPRLARNRVINTWEECEAEVNKIEETYHTKAWFRGQSNADWQLDTTLERWRRDKPFSVEEYLDLIRRVKPEIETFTGGKWDVPSDQDAFIRVRNVGDLPMWLPYEYMAHLRHHGFPSPLLDWTDSPYIAAYFAFKNAQLTRPVALYVYVEIPNKIKVLSSVGPYIIPVDHHMTTNERHFLQRSRYSTCLRYDGKNWLFVPHQEVLNVDDSSYQDALWRFVIPSTERTKVLRRLDRLNLNAYSLFGSEEALMETLAFREIDERAKTQPS
jgi:hypothetical protein